MPYEVHISEINVLTFSQSVAVLKILIIAKNGVGNDNVIAVTERFDHDRVVSISCVQKDVHKIQQTHEETYENVFVWTDGMGFQFRSCYAFNLSSSAA